MDVIGAVQKAFKAVKKFMITQKQLDDTLIEAVKAGDIVKLRKAVENGGNPSTDAGGWRNDSPLLIAIEAGNVEMLKALLELKANPDVQIGYRNNRPLIEAVRKGATEIATLLLAAGADVNGADDNGYTPFMMAVASRNKTLIDLFAAKGAKMEVVEGRGWTPLSYAVRNGDEATIALLLSKNVRTDYFDENGQSLKDIALAADKMAAYKLVQAYDDARVPAWQKQADPDTVAHVSILREAGYKLTEVFNLRTSRLTTITHNFDTGRDETASRALNDGDKAVVAEATQKLAALKPQPVPQAA